MNDLLCGAQDDEMASEPCADSEALSGNHSNEKTVNKLSLLEFVYSQAQS